MRLRTVVSLALAALLAGGMASCSSSSGDSADGGDPCVELAHYVCERPVECGVPVVPNCLQLQLNEYAKPGVDREGCRQALEVFKQLPCSYYRQ